MNNAVHPLIRDILNNWNQAINDCCEAEECFGLDELETYMNNLRGENERQDKEGKAGSND